ncbi:hypothetical protein GCM10009854_04820 [Saccharopolyspora halophila]|uniref:PI-PLC Y-box domain-containing protein n=1 Tax=Saccharopolyspora halophila TaxID=405551 RepID=A0ABP5SJL9_9PSEU
MLWGVVLVRPERRKPIDLLVVALIGMVLAVGGAVIWWNSDARATLSEPAAQPIPEPATPDALPDALHEVWRAQSPRTPVPVVADSAVVTAGGGEVRGHDPLTGRVAWRYARDLRLCTVGEQWNRAIAVYRKSHNCSEVTSLVGPTGVRGPQRNSNAEFGTRLLGDGTYLTATGKKVFPTWRSDLVRTQQYGIPPDIKNPDNNIERPDCTYDSIAVGDKRIGVIEDCPRETGRVTMLKAHPEDDEEPEEYFSLVLGDPNASVVAVSEQRIAVLLRGSQQVTVFDSKGRAVAQYPVRVGPPNYPDNVRIESTTTANKIYWWTGADTIALDPDTLTPQWTVRDTSGAGTMYAHHLALPNRAGVEFVAPGTGAPVAEIPVDRAGYTGSIRLNADGPVLLEQREDTLVALR